MKIVVVGDRPVPAGRLAEAAAMLKTGEENQIVELTWGSGVREELQAQQLNVEKNGPDAEPFAEGLDREIRDADMLLTHLAVVPESIIEKAERLRLIGTCRGGVEQIAVKAATEKKIPVIHVIRNAEAVAEFTIGLILAETRNIARASAAITSGGWQKDFANSRFTKTLKGQTLGIVGLGHIGRVTALKAQSLGMKIAGYDPYVSEEVLQDAGLKVERMELDELFRSADIVSLHLRATKETEGMIGKELLEQMKPEAYLINTARASVIVKEDLYQVLAAKKIGGAALDVFWEEPLPADDPYRKLDNVTLTTHLAGTVVDALPKSPFLLADVINEYLAMGRSAMQVNPF